jgi:hypothetical protein
LFFGLAYFVPTFVAFYRQHHNRLAIFVLNLLLGWSFIGWACALVWALTKQAEAPKTQSVSDLPPTNQP